MTPNQWNRNTRDSVVTLLTEAGFSEDSSVIHQLECMNFDEPTEPQSNGVIVPMELLVLAYQAVHALAGIGVDGYTEKKCLELSTLLGGETP